MKSSISRLPPELANHEVIKKKLLTIISFNIIKWYKYTNMILIILYYIKAAQTKPGTIKTKRKFEETIHII